MKLSEPQLRTLRDIQLGAHPVADYYPPAKALVAKGLAEWVSGNLSTVLKITPAGVKALEEPTR